VNHTEPRAQKPSFETGISMALGALLHGRGCLMPACASRPRRARRFAPALLALLAFVGVLIAGAVPALASGPPHVEFQGYGVEVFPTRLYVPVSLDSEELNTKWRAEYSTSKSALESGAGTVASSGELNIAKIHEREHAQGHPETKDPSNTVFFGELFGSSVQPISETEWGEPEGLTEVHHLSPATHYYARFVAENSAGKAVLPFEFTTLPVAKPEVPVGPGEGLGRLLFLAGASSPTTANLEAVLESNGAATHYEMGLSTSPSGAVTVCGESGSVSVAEDFAEPVDNCTGLSPETTYYVHLIATNEKGTIDQTKYQGTVAGGQEESFTTPTAKPIVSGAEFRNVTATSAHVTGEFLPHHEETRWRFESASSVLGPWSVVPGGSGTVSLAEAEALEEGVAPHVGVTLTGLSPDSTYYVRLVAENAAGEGENRFGEPVSLETRGVASVRTSAPPEAGTLAAHSLDGEQLRVIGTVDPDSKATSAEQTVTLGGGATGGTFTLTFAGQRTVPIDYDAPAQGSGSVQAALEGLPAHLEVDVEGPAGGPYTLYFDSSFSEEAVPLVEGDGSGLTPSGTVTVATTQQGGVAYDTHYRFQYVGEQQFAAEGGWAGAASTPEVDLGSGSEARFVAMDLSGLVPGEVIVIVLWRVVRIRVILLWMAKNGSSLFRLCRRQERPCRVLMKRCVRARRRIFLIVVGMSS
jgi:hypothetical protein